MIKEFFQKYISPKQSFGDGQSLNGINSSNIIMPSSGMPFRNTKGYNTPEEQFGEYKDWVFICSNLISNSIAATPLKVYAKTNGRKLKNFDNKLVTKSTDNYLKKMNGSLRRVDEIVELFDHPLSNILSFVNNTLTSFDLFYLTQSHLDLCGFSIWYIERNGKLIESLHPLNPKFIRVSLKNENEVNYYIYRINNKDIKIDVNNIVLFKNPNPTCLWDGKSIIQAGATSIGRMNDYNNYDASLIRNNAKPDFLVKYDGQLSDKQMKDLTFQWNRALTGEHNRGKVKIMDSKFSVEKLSFSPADIQFQNGRLMTNKEISSMFSIPYALIDSSDQLKAGLDQVLWQYEKFCLRPRLKRIEESLNEYLIPEYDDSGSLFVAYDNPVHAERNQEETRIIELLGANIIDRHEARNMLGIGDE